MTLDASFVRSKPHLTKKTKTRSITFRLPQPIVTELETEATNNGVSLNVLAKQIFEKFIQWDRFSEKIGMSPVPKPLLKVVGQDMTGSNIQKMADSLYSVIKDEVMFMKGGYDLRRCIETLEEYMKSSGMISDHRVEGSKHHFIIQHELGMNWSLFAELLLKKIFNDFLPDKILRVQTTDSTIIASIALGSDFDEHEY